MSKKKLLFLFAVALAVFAFALPLGVSADIIDEGSCGENLTWTLDDEGLLTIVGSGKMDDYAQGADCPWYPRREDIKTVVAEEGVTSVGAYAFKGCKGMRSATLPQSLTDIGDCAFEDCTALRELTLPDGVTSIGDGAFLKCVNLEKMTIPEGVKVLPKNAFSQCLHLESIELPQGMTAIGDAAFQNCIDLSLITLPRDTTTIGKNAFQNCRGLKNIVMNEKLTFVDERAFSFCSKLERVVLPESVTSLANSAFYGCDGLTSIVIPRGVTTIAERVFAECKRLTIYGKRDSAAQSYAASNGIPFIHYFDDVLSENAFYYAPVYWAVQNNVTYGMSVDRFAPEKICTRGQVVTFLWRAAGSPAAKTTNNPFRDVAEKDYFYDAVLWAASNGITKGTSAHTFSPFAPCTRCQVVTFLWRAAGKPEPESMNSSFEDVEKDSYYEKAVFWAAERGVTKGVSPTSFAPDHSCTRGQFVTFLYRAETTQIVR